MELVATCDAFDWTYQEYQAQPSWFIILKKMKRSKEEKLRESR